MTAYPCPASREPNVGQAGNASRLPPQPFVGKTLCRQPGIVTVTVTATLTKKALDTQLDSAIVLAILPEVDEGVLVIGTGGIPTQSILKPSRKDRSSKELYDCLSSYCSDRFGRRRSTTPEGLLCGGQHEIPLPTYLNILWKTNLGCRLPSCGCRYKSCPSGVAVSTDQLRLLPTSAQCIS